MRPALPQPDFLRPVARPGLLAWAWCTTGLLVLAVTALDTATAWQQRAEALASLRSVRLPPAAPAPGAVPRPAPRAPDDEARRWLRQLALPWPAVWSAGELAAGGVQWLALSHGSGSGLRLTGTAPLMALAEATAEALRRQHDGGRPVWQSVALAAVERGPDGLRFELVARLAEPPAGAP